MQHTEDAINDMRKLQVTLDRAYGEELCVRVDTSTRNRFMREIDGIVGKLQKMRRLVGGGVNLHDM